MMWIEMMWWMVRRRVVMEDDVDEDLRSNKRSKTIVYFYFAVLCQ